MKNYLSKIININIGNTINKLRKLNPFGLIIVLIALVFIFSLYFTIPTFYNYENYDKNIQKKVSKDFNLNLKNISGFTYLILPTPHFLIEECDIHFLNDPDKEILKAKHLKINIFSKNLHIKEKLEFKSIVLDKSDLDLQFNNLKNFYNFLKIDNSKPIYIRDSNFFFRDKNKEIILISKIKNFEYFFDLKSKSKKLNINGNLFGSNFNFKWIKNFSNPYITLSDFKFSNPNLDIINKFNRENEDYIKAETYISFLRNYLDLNYKFNQDSIVFNENKNKKINHSQLVGNIKLNPFFFDLNLVLSGIKLETVLNRIFLNLYKTNKTVNLNFNGNLKINLDEINSRLFENLIINMNFLDEKISLNNSSLKLKKIGKINFSDLEFYEKNQKLFVKSKIKFDVENQLELFKKFLIPRQNRIDLNKVFFEIEYNIDDGAYYLSNINFNEQNNDQKIFYEIRNIQQLNTVITSEFKKVKLD